MCDFGHKFCSNSAKLVPFKNTGGASMGDTMLVDDEYFVRVSLDSSPKTGFLLACPVCGVIHVEGFSLIDDKEEALNTEANVAPERNINLSL